MDKELNSLLESILLLLIQMLKGFIMGVWHGLRKALQNKWYLTGIGITLVFSVICITEKAMVCRMIPETIPEWLQQGIYLMLLAAPVIYLFLIGQTGQKNYDKCFEDIGFKGKNGKFPKYAGSSKEGKKILLFFQSTIPLSEWRSSRERLETALDCSIIKIENGRNKRTVKLTTLPSDYKIPTMVKWSEEYLNDKEHFDVYVLAEVQYEYYREQEATQESAETRMKVPVLSRDGEMVVDGLPMFVNDNTFLEDYQIQEYNGQAADEQTAAGAGMAVTSFLKAYYEQDETVIDYYLSQDADRSKFIGLDGRYTFDRMQSVRCYQEESMIVCIAEYKISDVVNGAKRWQKVRLNVVRGSDGKYYIQSMSARTTM